MTDVVVNLSQAPNSDKLHQELDVLTLGIYKLDYPDAYPGDVTAKYEPTLSTGDQTSVSDTITNHNPTTKTIAQQRGDQDIADLDELRTLFDKQVLYWNATDEDRFKELMNRCMLRLARTEPI